MNQHLQDIALEKQGFLFGESWRYSEDSLTAILPILRETSKKRVYLLLKESDKIEISDTGQINKVSVYNGDSKPVYIRTGEIFVGKTQSRAAVRSYFVMPKEKVQVEVKCVHASHPISSGSEMKSGGFTPSNIESNFIRASFLGRSVDQTSIWQGISNSSTYMSNAFCDMTGGTTIFHAGTPQEARFGIGESNDVLNLSDNLAENLEEFNRKMKVILEKVPYSKNQVGLATIDLDGVTGIECFDLKESWDVLKEDLVKKEAEKIVKQKKDSPFEYKKSKSRDVVKNVLLTEFEERTIFKSKDYRIVTLGSEKYNGELVEVGGDLIHLIVIRK